MIIGAVSGSELGPRLWWLDLFSTWIKQRTLGVRLRVGELGNMTIYSGFSLDRKPDQFRCYRPYVITTAGTNARRSSHGLGGLLDEVKTWFGLYHLDI